MASAPAVSIIVPNYNHARFLPKRIESILHQSYQAFEIILLDDCSSDDSRAILTRYTSDARVKVEFNNTNSGSSFKQWNKGIRLARGKYVWIAESDDYADERLLERLVSILDYDDAIAFAYCRSWCVTKDDEITGLADAYLSSIDANRWTKDFVMDGREAFQKYFGLKNPVPNASAVLLRRAVYERVGGADETLRLCGDWKLWASMAVTGKIAFLAEPLNHFRSHDVTVRSLASRAATDVLEYLEVTRWIIQQANIPLATLARIRKERANLWVPAVMSLRVSPSMKRQIIKSVRLIDPYLVSNAFVPALNTVKLKLARHWRNLSFSTAHRI